MTTGDDQQPAWPHVPVPALLLLDEHLSDSAKVLWALLYQVFVTGGRESFEMTIEDMMELSRAAKGSVIKRKKELTDAGWLEETALRGLGRANLYVVRVPGDQVLAPHSPADQT